MPVQAHAGAAPCADDVRTALTHMAESDSFRGSPQLVSFLRYVVEATLRGGAERIKGYTIAVEALGRNESFDPQSDPIVRVEAMRLRRALNRYYENGGSHDPIVIDLPLGSYVPTFRHKIVEPPPVAPAVIGPVSAPVESPWRKWHSTLSAAALVLLGALIYGALDFWFDLNAPNPRTAAHATQPPGLALRPAPAFPLVYIGEFHADDGSQQAVAERLRGKLRDALARFDEIAVISGQAPTGERQRAAPGNQYRLAANVETGASGLLSVSLRLSDVSDGHIAFARTFQNSQDGAGAAEAAVVREIAVTLAQPYGIIHARERAQQQAAPAGDPAYRCLLDSYDYWRSVRTQEQHMAVRDCLERATATDPSFAGAFAALSELALQEYRRGFTRPGETPALDRALQAARRAVEARPGSAHAHQALMDTLFLRGDYALSLEAGARAVALNPYHPSILGCYGARLLALGEVEKGARYLREAASAGAVRPEWLEFYLFLAGYLQDDERAVANHVAQLTSNEFSLGLLARALLSLQHGKVAAARGHFDRLMQIQPRWRQGVEPELRRMFPADAVAGRLTRDLAQLSSSLGQ